jgi:glycosyltransferase involved in cell wall biosynthesis
MLINILIPTYNREPDLKVNLLYLIGEILKDELQSKVSIIVSDNCSQDQTQESVTELIENYPKIKIEYFRQSTNIGLEKNTVFVFSKATAGHVMFIGDDDLIDKGYLCFCTDQIKKDKNLGCIISGLKSVKKNGDEQIGRNENFKSKTLNAGYDSLIEYSHYAHQMSGLLIQNNSVLPNYLKKAEYRNPYLFIYFASYQLYHKKSIYAPEYKTAVQVENEKDWGYNEIGLLDQVFKSYFYFKDVFTKKQLSDILLHFVKMHSYRLTINAAKPLLIYKQARMLSELDPENKVLKRGLFILLIKEYLLSVIR